MMTGSAGTRWLAAVALACASHLAAAVDPLLHELSGLEAAAESASTEAAFSPAVGPEDWPAEVEDQLVGIEVSAIRDFGPEPLAPEAPGDLWERIRRGFAIADLASPAVAKREAWYAQRPDLLRLIVERSRRYLFHIVEELERRGLPTELALLPMVESAYNPLAYSRAHASGLWQFIPSTARNYNLGQNWWYDARRDVVASTNAALDYLQSLRETFGDWHLALAAYNMGENGLSRAIEHNRARKRPTDYGSLRLPKETRLYVPTLQALKNIVADPAAFGLELEPIPDAPYFVAVDLTRDVDLHLAAKLAEMPLDELLALNPGHNRPVAVAAHAQQLVLPADRVEAFLQNLKNHDEPLSSWQTYTVKAGDKLERLAAEFGVSAALLRSVNGLRPTGGVIAGQQLLLPRKGVQAATRLPSFQSPAHLASYVVRQGDTWARIARAFGVRMSDLRLWNDGVELIPGESVVIDLAPKKGARTAGSRVKRAPPKPRRPATGSSPSPAAPVPLVRPAALF